MHNEDAEIQSDGMIHIYMRCYATVILDHHPCMQTPMREREKKVCRFYVNFYIFILFEGHKYRAVNDALNNIWKSLYWIY